jgi:hypothetical protein
MNKAFAIFNAAGKVYAGTSTLSGQALWFVYSDGDDQMLSLCLKFKRDARTLAKAKQSDVTAEWREI